MGTAVISLPVLIGIHAPRDAWVAAVIFTVGGILLSLIVGALAKMFPEKNFVTCVEKVFGSLIGKVIILVFTVWLFHTTSFVIWQTSTLTKISLLPKTPLVIVTIISLIPPMYAVYCGIERVARSGQFIFIFNFGLFISLFFLYSPDIDLTNLLPVFDDGVYNILRSSIAPLAWAGEIMFILFLVPNIEKKTKITNYSIITILIIGIGGIINEVFYTGVFGPLRQYLAIPYYTLISYTSPNSFIERYDVALVSVNLTGNFIKLSVFIYILVYCLSQLLGMKNHSKLTLPVVIALIISTFFTVQGQPQLVNFLDSVFPFYTIPLLYGLPLITLLIAKIRRL